MKRSELTWSRREWLRRGLAGGAALALTRPVRVNAGPAAPGTAAAAVTPPASAKLPFPDLATAGLDYRNRASWAVASPDLARLRKAERFDRITVHHSGVPNRFHMDEPTIINDLNGVCTGHCERNYGDIGYHFVVDVTGRVWQGRSLAYVGAHVSGQNRENIGIMLLGNFEVQGPAAEQLGALKRVVAVMCRHYGMNWSSVYGHRDLGHSACPGASLYEHLVAMRNRA